MITPSQALSTFGAPGLSEYTYMYIWQVPANIRDSLSHVFFTAAGTTGFPARIYLNMRLKAPLERALLNLIDRNCSRELITWDGCYMIRNGRGLSTWSLHAWGLAVDVNAATNRLSEQPTLSQEFVNCFIDAGFDWGGIWERSDGMHFQLAHLN